MCIRRSSFLIPEFINSHRFFNTTRSFLTSSSDRPGGIRTREFVYNSSSEAFATSALASQTELKVTSSFLVLPSTNFPMRLHSLIGYVHPINEQTFSTSSLSLNWRLIRLASLFSGIPLTRTSYWYSSIFFYGDTFSTFCILLLSDSSIGGIFVMEVCKSLTMELSFRVCLASSSSAFVCGRQEPQTSGSLISSPAPWCPRKKATRRRHGTICCIHRTWYKDPHALLFPSHIGHILSVLLCCCCCCCCCCWGFTVNWGEFDSELSLENCPLFPAVLAVARNQPGAGVEFVVGSFHDPPK